jgi:hypothetical protein
MRKMVEFEKAEEAGLILASQENDAGEMLRLNEGRKLTPFELENALLKSYRMSIDAQVRGGKLFAGRAATCECCGNENSHCNCFGGC